MLKSSRVTELQFAPVFGTPKKTLSSALSCCGKMFDSTQVWGKMIRFPGARVCERVATASAPLPIMVVVAISPCVRGLANPPGGTVVPAPITVLVQEGKDTSAEYSLLAQNDIVWSLLKFAEVVNFSTPFRYNFSGPPDASKVNFQVVPVSSPTDCAVLSVLPAGTGRRFAVPKVELSLFKFVSQRLNTQSHAELTPRSSESLSVAELIIPITRWSVCAHSI